MSVVVCSITRKVKYKFSEQASLFGWRLAGKEHVYCTILSITKETTLFGFLLSYSLNLDLC